jgi:membrane-associated protein
MNILESAKTFFELLFTGELEELIKFVGYAGVWGIIFAESGLLVGFFLPGDSLIFTAGLLSSPLFGFFNVWTMLIGAWIAAIVGDNVGYEFGKRVGRSLFVKEKSLLFNPSNLLKAQEFYEKHGGKAIVLARFMPVVRTFAPVVAGIAHMDHKKFTFFNAIGGTLWVWGLTWSGYFLGSLIPDVDRYLLPIVGLIIVASVLPPALHLYKENKKSWDQKAIDYLKLIRYRFLNNKKQAE